MAEIETFVDDGRALLHVLDGFASFLLDAPDELGNFLGALRRFFRQLANFVGDYREAKAVFAGARGFDGRVQCE